MKKAGKNLTEKVIRKAAQASSESAAWFVLYESKRTVKYVKTERFMFAEMRKLFLRLTSYWYITKSV